MNLLRRISATVVVLALLLTAANARAQVLKQLHPDPLLVIKVNNPDGVSQKVGALMQRLGLANFSPELADPIAALKRQLSIKEGFDGKGELCMGIYGDPAGGPEPHVVVLIPVTDYKAFLGNLPAVKDEGGGVSSFVAHEGGETVYAANRGAYAAVSNIKEMVSKEPTGVTIPSAAAQAQFEKADAVVWANTKHIAAQVLPMFKQGRPQWMIELDQGLAGAPPAIQPYAPAIKAVVTQALNTAEETLMDTTASTIALNIGKDGIAATVLADFVPDSYIGKLMVATKNTDANLLAGLPNRKYFMAFGASMNSEQGAALINDLINPVAKELTAVGADAKPFLDLIDAIKQMPAAVKTTSAGYAVPTGAPGTQALFQPVVVATGNAAKISELQRKSMKGSIDLMKMMPNQGGLQMELNVEDGAATIAGVKLDKVTMKFNVDPNNPQAQQVKPMIDMMYGPNGMSGVMGPISDTVFIQALGGDDELLNAVVAAAKAGDPALAQEAHIKSVAAQLPQNRVMVAYVHVDNIVSTALAYAAQFGFRVPLKLQPNIPPIGITVGTEGSAIRIDTVISNELIENAVSAGMQVWMMQQGGNRPPGAL